jgi:hypothetical protein
LGSRGRRIADARSAGLHSLLQPSLDYMVRQCLNKIKPKQTKMKNQLSDQSVLTEIGLNVISKFRERQCIY